MTIISKNTKTHVKVAIVGCGEVAERGHFPVWAREKQSSVIAVCDRDDERSSSCADKWGISQKYIDLRELLNNEPVDLIDICTPQTTHLDMIKIAAEFNVHCLVEKPLVLNSVQVAEIKTLLACNHNISIFPLYNLSVTPCFIKTKDMISKKNIGKVMGLDIKCELNLHKYLDDRSLWVHKLPGGIIGEVIPHLSMIVCEIIGKVDAVESIALRSSSYEHVLYDDIRIAFKNTTCLGSIALSMNCPSSRIMADITGTKGSLFVDNNSQAVIRRRTITDTTDVLNRGLDAIQEITTRAGSLIVSASRLISGSYRPWIYGHQYLINKVVNTILYDSIFPLRLEDAFNSIYFNDLIISSILIDSKSTPNI